MSNRIRKFFQSICKKKDCTEENKEISAQNHDLNREQWSSKLDFILSCVGYAIGNNILMF